MDLHQALYAINAPVHVRGTADHTLARWVEQTVTAGGPTTSHSQAKAIGPAAGLENGVHLRAIDALHRLALVTGPRFQDDLHDVYARWALHRYLGTFDHAWPDRLVLSDPARRVAGNQRRVMSEELGIAIGLEITAEWLRTRFGRRAPVLFVDIDTALTEGGVPFGGRLLRVHQIDTVRPDYVAVANVGGGRYRLALVECKGSTSSTYARRQLVNAVG